MSTTMSVTYSDNIKIINCIFLGHSHDDVFSIEIGDHKTISILKQEIAKRRPDVVGDLVPDKLELFFGNIFIEQETGEQEAGKQETSKEKTDEEIEADIQKYMKRNPRAEKPTTALKKLPLLEPCIHFIIRVPNKGA
ncbi:hypothetical protein FRC20_008121 [Serendipita sp. 405]|nr:hypothetical protein FRC20_008121 [Serendipita sp. 405]